MNTGIIAKQTIAFQKSLFENTFGAMTMVQDQTEKMLNTFLEQMTWVPEDGKKGMNEAISFYKKARDDFKKAVDDGFVKIEEQVVQK